MIDDLARVLADDDPARREAAALALAQSPDDRAAGMLAAHPELNQDITSGALTWDSFAAERIEQAT